MALKAVENCWRMELSGELDLELAGPSDHIFPFEQVQDNWEEREQHYADISGKLLPPEFRRDGRAGRNQVV